MTARSSLIGWVASDGFLVPPCLLGRLPCSGACFLFFIHLSVLCFRLLLGIIV